LVVAHRYTGLALAAFLILEGLTGSLLAFNPQLERFFSPRLYVTPIPSGPRLSLGTLAERAEKLVPDAQVDDLYAYPDRTMVEMEARDFDQLFFDPWTGQELGRRKYGDLSQGPTNVMPFVYNLHANLAWGPTGELILGGVALVWTLDCFVAYYLTLPSALQGFWRRWQLAWRIKRNAGVFRFNFDVHRASGLWLWPPLLIFAWSSVMLALPSVYDRVMGVFFEYRPTGVDAADPSRSARPPRLGWVEAERIGAALLAKEATVYGFRVVAPPNYLAFAPTENAYSYRAGTNFDVRGQTSDTTVWFDGDSGRLRRLDLPSRRHAGNTLSIWFAALHFADLRNSALYRAAVFVLGLAIAALAVTGIYIWLAKRNHRRMRGARQL
jgi:uncharacterized iron-regulated membrane protein